MLMVVPTPDASVMLVKWLVPDAKVVVEVSLGLSHILKSLPKNVGVQAVPLIALALRPAKKLPVAVDNIGIM